MTFVLIERSDIVALKELGYGEGCRYIETLHKKEMAVRTKNLRSLNKDEAETVAMNLGGEIVDFSFDESTEWAIAFSPI